jgi:very-short-patch-repair endonuclease
MPDRLFHNRKASGNLTAPVSGVVRDMKDLPEELMTGPFTRRRAIALGVTPKTLRGKRFVRLHRGVLCLREVAEQDVAIAAARLALPPSARLTGITKLQRLGLDFGPRLPLHFVVEGELHLAIPGIFLHRTKKLAPHDDEDVTIEAAFIAYCATARLIDAIKVGDWLLYGGHMTMQALVELANQHLWRAGADESLYVSNHLDARSRSLKESETRAVLEFAGLPAAEVNLELEIGGRLVIGDLVYVEWRTLVEYEGKQHQEQPEQYESDIDRYASLRHAGYHYVQITDQRLAKPRRAVKAVYAELAEAGYEGPAPQFTDTWRSLFMRVSRLLGPRRLDHPAA